MIIYDSPTDRQVRGGAQRGRVLLTSHLMSTWDGPNGRNELVAFADGIGLQRRWLEKPGTTHEHFDLIGTKRIRAAREAGATLWTLRQMGELLRIKRQHRSAIRLLVTGSRELAERDLDDDRDLVECVLCKWAGEHRQVIIVHGAASGADQLADWVAQERGWTVERYPARDFSWPTARNQHMVDLGADRCLAFPSLASRGTWDCVNRAKRAGITVDVRRVGGAP